jgi:hypothetical protein
MIRTIILRVAFGIVVGGLLFAVLRNDAGGLVVLLALILASAWGIHLLARRGPGPIDDPMARRTQSTDVINMSSIRVAGVGGLAFVAVAAGIAIAIPRIGQTLIVGAIGGAIVAFAVIRYRRTHGGPLDSSHDGGRAMLVEPHANESASESEGSGVWRSSSLQSGHNAI